MKKIRQRLTYANVMSSMAVFLVLGGGAALAAKTVLPKKSVGTKQLKSKSVSAAKLKKNAVTTAKIKKDAVTGAKVNEATLGTVPSAGIASSLTPPEAVHLVGAPGEPPFEDGAKNPSSSEVPYGFTPVGFYKDHDGIVHLQGVAQAGTELGLVFTLPPGFRPAANTIIPWNFGGEGQALIVGSGIVSSGIDLSGKVAGEPGGVVTLDGLEFRPGS